MVRADGDRWAAAFLASEPDYTMAAWIDAYEKVFADCKPGMTLGEVTDLEYKLLRELHKQDGRTPVDTQRAAALRAQRARLTAPVRLRSLRQSTRKHGPWRPVLLPYLDESSVIAETTPSASAKQRPAEAGLHERRRIAGLRLLRAAADCHTGTEQRQAKQNQRSRLGNSAVRWQFRTCQLDRVAIEKRVDVQAAEIPEVGVGRCDSELGEFALVKPSGAIRRRPRDLVVRPSTLGRTARTSKAAGYSIGCVARQVRPAGDITARTIVAKQDIVDESGPRAGRRIEEIEPEIGGARSRQLGHEVGAVIEADDIGSGWPHRRQRDWSSELTLFSRTGCDLISSRMTSPRKTWTGQNWR